MFHTGGRNILFCDASQCKIELINKCKSFQVFWRSKQNGDISSYPNRKIQWARYVSFAGCVRSGGLKRGEKNAELWVVVL